MHIVRILRICSDIYIITLLVFVIETVTARRWQYFLCVESKGPLSCGVLNYLKNNPELQKVGTQFTFFDLPSLLC